MEACVDDLVVKTWDKATLLEDLAETFGNLRKMCMKLNPGKCIFGVLVGKLLGFLVSSREIEINSKKIKAIEKMRPLVCLKDVQRIAGCMAALGRFVSKLGEKALPLFKLLNRTGPFRSTPEAEQALQQMKVYPTSPPVIVAPEPREPLLLYIAATPHVMSAVLVVEREESIPPPETPKGPRDQEEEKRSVQRPVYFVSKVLHDAEARYPTIQKML